MLISYDSTSLTHVLCVKWNLCILTSSPSKRKSKTFLSNGLFDSVDYSTRLFYSKLGSFPNTYPVWAFRLFGWITPSSFPMERFTPIQASLCDRLLGWSGQPHAGCPFTGALSALNREQTYHGLDLHWPIIYEGVTPLKCLTADWLNALSLSHCVWSLLDEEMLAVPWFSTALTESEHSPPQ